MNPTPTPTNKLHAPIRDSTSASDYHLNFVGDEGISTKRRLRNFSSFCTRAKNI